MNFNRRVSAFPLLALAVAMVPSARARADQGMTSPAHSENVGKIVFSSEVIAFRKEEPGAFKREFSAAGTIHGRVYLARSVANTEVHLGSSVSKGARDFEVRLFVGDTEKKFAFDVFYRGALAPDAAEMWTTWRLDLSPRPDDKLADARIVANWAKSVNSLAPGRHTVRVEIWVTQGQMRSDAPVAAGKFELVKNKGERLAIGGGFPSDAYRGADIDQIKTAT